jgi:hypothetical protein
MASNTLDEPDVVSEMSLIQPTEEMNRSVGQLDNTNSLLVGLNASNGNLTLKAA